HSPRRGRVRRRLFAACDRRLLSPPDRPIPDRPLGGAPGLFQAAARAVLLCPHAVASPAAKAPALGEAPPGAGRLSAPLERNPPERSDDPVRANAEPG